MVFNVGHMDQLFNLAALQQVLPLANIVAVVALVQLLDIDVDVIVCYRIVVVMLQAVLNQQPDVVVRVYTHVIVITYYL